MTTNSSQNFGGKLYAVCSGDPGAAKESGDNFSGEEDFHVPPLSVRRHTESLGSMKEPWVPAPGRTTKATSGHRSSAARDQNIHEKCVSNPEMLATAKSSTSSLFGKSSYSKVKTKSDRGRISRRSKDRSWSGYDLNSKDSLVDITVRLQARREAVLDLWQKNLANNDQALLAELEKANMLALEATTEVTKLKAAFQDLHNKGKIPSLAETESLQEMRLRIHEKLLEFEASQSQIDLNLRKSRDSSRKSRGSQTSLPLAKKSSSTEFGVVPARTSSSSLIYIKEKSSRFSGPETESDTENEQGDKNEAYLKRIFDKEQTDSGSESIDLSKLKRLYSEGFEVSKLPELNKSDLADISEVDSESGRHALSGTGEEKSQPTKFRNAQNFDDSLGYYRDKIHELYKKLLDQEFNFEEMSRALQRIDSDKDFQIKMLKSNISSQLEDLAPLPELMERSEKRLNEAIVAKFAVESSLQLKVQEIKALSAEIERLEKALQESKSALERSEGKHNAIQDKIEKLEQENKGLRSELSARNDILLRLEEKTQSQEPQQKNDNDRRYMILEDRILELEHALAKEKKKTGDLKHENDSFVIERARREQELMAELEKYKMKYHGKVNYLNEIKSSYYEIFSPYFGTAIFPESMKAVSEQLLSRQGDNNPGEDETKNE